MFKKYLRFIRGVALNRIGLTGVVLTTSSFGTFLVLEAARLAGILTNAYVGLVTYMLFPAVFVIGLVLIPIGWRLRKKRTGKTTAELLDERFATDQVKGGFWGSKLSLTVGLFTLVNIVFLGAASTRMLSFMDEPTFCGTACHSVMNPEWVTYQLSPHARVRCVDCHVGEGAQALVDSKLNGLWQIISVTFDLLERPIPTPVHQLRPARETCEKCHWPDKFYGSRLTTVVQYDKDATSTPRYTTLNLKVDPGKGADKGGIHWHIAAENEVRYASLGDKREVIIWTRVKRPDGSFRQFTNRALASSTGEEQQERVLDCVDCHNRATHIYEQPGDAVDRRMRLGRINRSLPYVKREGLAAITIDYANQPAAMEGITNHMWGFYQRRHPDVAVSEAMMIDSAVAALQEIYVRNIHHGMNITWGSYPSHIGHVGTSGCFRCHNANMTDDAGNSVSSDCGLCHSILAFRSGRPFDYLQPIDTTLPDYLMRQYLQQEFLDYTEE